MTFWRAMMTGGLITLGLVVVVEGIKAIRRPKE